MYNDNYNNYNNYNQRNETVYTDGNVHKWESHNSDYAKPEKQKFNKILIIPVVIALVVGIVAGGAFTTIGYRLGLSDSSSASSGLNANLTSTGINATEVTGAVDVSDVVSDFMPAVVALTSMSQSSSYYPFTNSSEEVATGAGSGVIIAQNDTELLILTSYHVVEDTSSVVVKFCNDTEVTGSLKSAESVEDLAIVSVPLSSIDSDTLSAIKVAAISENEPDVGDGVIVIGNALNYGQSVTYGIVSAKDKEVTLEGSTYSLLQTDAAINSGNSGGAVINTNGELVGVSEARVNSTYAESMCFAIPITDKTEIIQNLINSEARQLVAEDKRGYLGIYGQDVSSSMASSVGVSTGVYIKSTIEGGAAESAGLSKSDVITAIDGNRISSMSDLVETLSYYEAGESVKVSYYTVEGNEYVAKTVELTLGSASK